MLRELKPQHSDAPPAPHETKFVLPSGAGPIVRRWLRLRCPPDPRYPASIVSSIYFDTPDWVSLAEKVNSDFAKLKARLRWYSDPASGEAEGDSYLELKLKWGRRREKRRWVTTLPGVLLARSSLDSRRLLDLVRELSGVDPALAGRLRPAFEIRYRRSRFRESTTRAGICCDYDIHVPRVSYGMLPRARPVRLGRDVVELKGPMSELPAALRGLTALGCRKASFSKYLECYTALVG